MSVMGKMYLETAKRNVWIIIGVFTLFMLAHQAWTPTASIYKHTYELSDPPGQLTTDRGTFDFLASFTIAFMWLVPLTAALMVSYMGARWSENLHMAITFILWLWFIVVFVWQLYSLATANPNPTMPSDLGDRLNNPATDKRWCCVYGPLGIGSPCHLNTFNTTCSPFISQEMLGIDGTFLFAFILNIILVVLLTVQFFWVLCSYRPQVMRGISLLNGKGADTDNDLSQPIGESRRYAARERNYSVASIASGARIGKQNYKSIPRIGIK